MKQFSRTNIEILRQLNRYRFLTVPQFVRLRVGVSGTIYRSLGQFKGRKKKYIGIKDLGMLPTKGRLRKVYYLEKGGAALLQEALALPKEEISFEENSPPYLQDYFHRVATIDFQIELNFFAEEFGYEVTVFHTYYDREGANRGTPPSKRLHSLTKAVLQDERSVIADFIFILEDQKEKKSLFVGEMYNGRDTKRVHKQLKTHIQALIEGVFSTKYGLSIPSRVLAVFETEAAMNSVIKRCNEDPGFKDFIPYFAFAVSNKLQKGTKEFGTNWLFLDGKKRSIFN